VKDKLRKQKERGKNRIILQNDLKRLVEAREKKKTPEALKSLYRSPGNKKKQLILCKNYVLQW
jgi:hypothetical protein